MISPIVRIPQAVFERFAAGESLKLIAEDYDLTFDVCEELLQTQCKILTMPKKKTTLKKLLGKYNNKHQPNMRWEALLFAARYAYYYQLALPEWFMTEYRNAAKGVLIDNLPIGE